ncbi:hypothetical protein C0Q70_01147 [Pomacea canaliculata]|uniref:Uncharacterized protein n=1 Tax=Pomacea canaliculata TaxID=400727 RepID=A0A2T7PYN6_POMCA|nr:high-affinity choline transporter 1-like isoform X1 [Pomacea canaliculata]PVD38531.1 hypothetical protein C0Q70_01147 [Pomacea canaliculata]
MAVSIAGVISIVVFYLVILVIGLIAARKSGFRARNIDSQDVILAGRNIGLFVGVFTMTATWVGGGYINGAAEIVGTKGLVWCQAPFGYTISLIFGGLFFAAKMRKSGFTTLLDPFHQKYGRLMGCLLYLPALTGEVFWSAAILATLGATLKVILDIDLSLSILISAAIALLYTLLGGLYSVAYTDIVQLICIFVGLIVGVPFAATHEAARSLTENSTWLGSVDPAFIGTYIDYYLLLIFGGIPWQVYWQRALSAKTVAIARGLSVLGALGCLILAVPPVLLGAVAATADWNKTAYGQPSLAQEDVALTLPLVYFHMTPVAVSFVGLGAISAAVMSSTDSSFLSASSMFACNVFGVMYQLARGQRPSGTMTVWVMRCAQVVIAGLACGLALTVTSVYYLVGAVLRLRLRHPLPPAAVRAFRALEQYIRVSGSLRLRPPLPPARRRARPQSPTCYSVPLVRPSKRPEVPFRTLAMFISLASHLGVSAGARQVFRRTSCPPTWTSSTVSSWTRKQSAVVLRTEPSTWRSHQAMKRLTKKTR